LNERKNYISESQKECNMSLQDYKNYKSIFELFSPYENTWFPLFISLIYALIFTFIVLIVTHIDKNYENAVYGIRVYPWGNWVGLISIPIFATTFISTKFIQSAFSKAMAVFYSSFIIFAVLSLTNFNIGSPAEVPNMILFTFFMFSIFAITIIVFIHYRKMSFNFIQDMSISSTAKIEKVKFEYDTHIKILITIIASLQAAAYTMYNALPRIIDNFTTGIGAMTFVFNNVLLAGYVVSLLVIIFVIQTIVVIYFIANQLAEIKSSA